MNNYTSREYGLTTTAVQVTEVNKNRKSLVLFNTGADACFIMLGDEGQVNIPAGDHIAFVGCTVPINAIYAGTTSGTSTLVVWEA